MKNDATTSDDNQAGKGTNERPPGMNPKEQPKFPKWKLSHETLARQDPVKYRAREEATKAYHWVVLTFLTYDPSMIGIEQSTWHGGKGTATAFGKITKYWNSTGRECFQVEAWNRKGRDTYVVVFTWGGKFLEAYSKTRDDIPEEIYPIAARRAQRMLSLSRAVGDQESKIITQDAMNRSVCTTNEKRRQRSLLAFSKYVIPNGIELGLIERVGDDFKFTMSHDQVRATLISLNPNIKDK
jgi:hypothetical protein